jgi:F0F1-type ATP synthase delta subunit
MNKSRHHLAEVIAEKTLKTSDKQLLAKEIAAYLMDENITTSLDSLVRDIMQYRSNKGIVEATAVSVSELSPNVINDLVKMVKDEYPGANQVVINQKIDEDVIGGLRLDFANEHLDMSVKAKLNKFKRLTAQGKE